MATNLFRFDFLSPLTNSQIEALKSVTGMRIGDVDNPYKDTPGKGRFAGNVYIILGRERAARAWHITAFSHDIGDADLQSVAATQQRLRDLMPRIASEWSEVGSEAHQIRTRVIDAGGVRAHKETADKHETAAVTSRREQVAVERVPVSGHDDADAARDAFQRENGNSPVVDQDAVAKRARRVEETPLHKDITADLQLRDSIRNDHARFGGADDRDDSGSSDYRVRDGVDH